MKQSRYKAWRTSCLLCLHHLLLKNNSMFSSVLSILPHLNWTKVLTWEWSTSPIVAFTWSLALALVMAMGQSNGRFAYYYNAVDLSHRHTWCSTQKALYLLFLQGKPKGSKRAKGASTYFPLFLKNWPRTVDLQVNCNYWPHSDQIWFYHSIVISYQTAIGEKQFCSIICLLALKYLWFSKPSIAHFSRHLKSFSENQIQFKWQI